MNTRPDILLVLKSGGEYGPEHAYRLIEQLKGENVVVYTDFALENVETRPFIHAWEGWWSKMEMFRHRKPFLYMDLDTTVVKSLDSILEAAQQHSFVALRDFYRGEKNKNALGSGLMYSDGTHEVLYERFRDNPRRVDGGDQIFIQKNVENPTFWQDITNEISSWKVRTNEDPAIWVFHGYPRPWDLK